jgi:phage-related protein
MSNLFVFYLKIKVTANVTASTKFIAPDSTIVIKNFQKTISNITATFQNCVQAKTNFALDALKKISASYDKCIEKQKVQKVYECLIKFGTLKC